MRIYYVGESRSRNLSVATALGVDGEHWDDVSENIQDWRWVMEDEFNVPTGRTLRGADLLSPKGSLPRGLRRRLTTLEEGLDIIMTSLRVLESAGCRQGGIGVINVCRRNSPFRQHRRRDRAAARERLLELVNASLAADGRYAFFIEDEAERTACPPSPPGPCTATPYWPPAPTRGTATPPESPSGTPSSTPRRTEWPGTTSCCRWPGWSPTPCSSRRTQPPCPRP